MDYELRGDLNPLEVIVVTDDLQKRGVERATLRPGNECIWVSHGRCECYYIFREGKLIGVQYD